MEPSLDDYRWLTGPAAARLLADAADSWSDPLTAVAKFRQVCSPVQAHLLATQLELRQRGRKKFRRASEMFFTRRGLEQATDELVAQYKASRFATKGHVADLCCGIGGDLLALTSRNDAAQGVDRDPMAAHLAATNVQVTLDAATVTGVGGCGGRPDRVIVADVDERSIADCAAWHIDPDRRPQGRRTTRLELHEPDLNALERLLAVCPHAAIKLAPAAEPPDSWLPSAECEWIERGRECRQLIVWHGDLARHAGRRCATIVAEDAGTQTCAVLRTVVGDAQDDAPSVAAAIGPFVYEPAAAVLAAGLTATLCREHALATVAPNSAYLTGDHEIRDSALSCFAVLETLPFQAKRLKAMLRQRGIGRLEVKTRGVPYDPAELVKQLQTPGEQAGVVLLTKVNGRVTAILASRI